MKMTIVADSRGNLVGAVHGHALSEKRGDVEATVSFDFDPQAAPGECRGRHGQHHRRRGISTPAAQAPAQAVMPRH